MKKTAVAALITLSWSIVDTAGLPDIFWEKSQTLSKKAKRGKKSQIVKNHEVSAFSICYHVFSKVVNKANGTVTDYAHGNLKFRHFQCITFAATSLNNFEGSLSCWWNFPPCFSVFSWFIKLLTTVPWYNSSVAWLAICIFWTITGLLQPKKCLFPLLLCIQSLS